MVQSDVTLRANYRTVLGRCASKLKFVISNPIIQNNKFGTRCKIDHRLMPQNYTNENICVCICICISKYKYVFDPSLAKGHGTSRKPAVKNIDPSGLIQ